MLDLSAEKIFKFLGHSFFIVYFAYCLLYYTERILFVDSAFQFFKLINFESLNIEAGRFPAIIPQIPVLIASRAGADLQGLLPLFSLSFPLLYYLIFLIITYKYKNVPLGIALCFTLVVAVRHSFFHPVTETHQALVYSCLFAAWSFSKKGYGSFKKIDFIAGIIFLFLAFFSHPVAFFTLIFIVIFKSIDTAEWREPKMYLLPLLLFILAILKFIFTPSGNYEGQFLSQIQRFPELLPKYRQLYTHWFYNHLFPEVYRIPFWCIIFSSVLYLFRGDFLKMVFVPLFYFGFISFTHLIYHEGDSQIMLERAYMPLAFFAAAPLAHDFLKGGRSKWIKTFFLVAIFTFSFLGIKNASVTFSQRINYMNKFFSLMDERNISKLLISEKNISGNVIYVPWAFGVETLLLSSIHDESKTIFISNDIEKDKKLDDEKTLLYVHFDKTLPQQFLNSKHFQFPHQSYFIWEEPFLFEK